MADLFSKVSELLSDPESAKKIRQIAASLSGDSPTEPGEDVSLPVEEAEASSVPDDGSLGNLFSGFASAGASHSREVALLSAMRPYLRSSRAGKIDRAIRAIRMIDMLSNFR